MSSMGAGAGGVGGVGANLMSLPMPPTGLRDSLSAMLGGPMRGGGAPPDAFPSIFAPTSQGGLGYRGGADGLGGGGGLPAGGLNGAAPLSLFSQMQVHARAAAAASDADMMMMQRMGGGGGGGGGYGRPGGGLFAGAESPGGSGSGRVGAPGSDNVQFDAREWQSWVG